MGSRGSASSSTTRAPLSSAQRQDSASNMSPEDLDKLRASGDALGDSLSNSLKGVLTEEELRSVELYTKGSFSSINKALRTDKVTPSAATNIKNIDAAFAKATPLPEDIVVRRRTNYKPLHDMFESGQIVGARITDKGFMSTTSSRESALLKSIKTPDINMHILVRKGKKIVPAHTISKHKAEREFILPRGSSLRVIPPEKTLLAIDPSW
jgi:hypothetical protein